MWHKNGWNALNKRKPGHVKGTQFKGVRMSDHPFPHFLTSKDDLFLKSLNIKMHDQESNSSQSGKCVLLSKADRLLFAQQKI